ncbi:MAG TPA: toll/interleukin-1 receptor domain-containing protein, partial [Polyangiaceae bacterium]
MSGIISYFHGESGTADKSWWELSGATPTYCLTIDGDPHREFAYDSGADIGIDPGIASGDPVIYLRLEDTTGIWVRAALQSADELKLAIARVLQNRRYVERWRHAQSDDDFVTIAREIHKTSGEPLWVMANHTSDAAVAVLRAGWALFNATYGGIPDERPQTTVSYFLSHAAEDTLLCRRIFEDLTNAGNAKAWFDLAQPAEGVPADDTAIAEWLRNSIYAANGFVSLWTEHAAQSAWVKLELTWAEKLRRSRPDFEVIVLKLRDLEVPADLQAQCTVIDCNEIWWSNGLNEELYAAVYRRQPRRAWLAALQPGAPVSAGTTIGYDDFISDSGVVVQFDWTSDPAHAESLQWRLEYRRRDGSQRRVTGGGSDSAADLGMKPGDAIGFFKVR